MCYNILPKITNFQQKFTRYINKQKNVTHTPKKGTVNRRNRMLEIAEKDFKAAVITMFEELKEIMLKNYRK